MADGRLRWGQSRASFIAISGAVILATMILLGCKPAPQAQSQASSVQSQAEAAQILARTAYELQESCGRTARDWFKGSFGDGVRSTPYSETKTMFESHYNSRANKCYVLLVASVFDKDAAARKLLPSTIENLVDVNANKVIESYAERGSPVAESICTAADSKCETRESWNALIKQYLER